MSTAADILLFIGSVFMFLAALGLVRMPDVYTRLQAGTKAATLGAFSILFAVLLYHPNWAAKLILIIFFILLTSPVGSSTIARSALLFGNKPWRTKQQELQQELQHESQQDKTP
jgi:multicomponent Na+:H+ antiporter subunit G